MNGRKSAELLALEKKAAELAGDDAARHIVQTAYELGRHELSKHLVDVLDRMGTLMPMSLSLPPVPRQQADMVAVITRAWRDLGQSGRMNNGFQAAAHDAERDYILNEASLLLPEDQARLPEQVRAGIVLIQRARERLHLSGDDGEVRS